MNGTLATMIRLGLVAGLVAAVLAVIFLRPTKTGEESAGEWTCSMHPQIRQPNTGRCPICGMDLVPAAQLAKEKARIENRARVNLPNTARELRPGMYASVTLRIKLRGDGTPEPTGLEGKFVCPMHPEVIRAKAGRCSICEMPLEKVPELKPGADPAKGHEGHAHHEQPAKTAQAEPPPGKVLAIPASAVLDTGRRKVAYRQTKDGAYELVDPKLGPRADGIDDQGSATRYFPVLGGVTAGDRVVVRGAFLLDSQRQIEGMPSLLYPQGQSAAMLHSGHGGTPQAKPEHKH